MQQSTNKIIMIKPHFFHFNEETAQDNTYQNNISANNIASKAVAEFDNFVNILQNEGIAVHVIEDVATPPTPDSVFPNNWFSTHNGTLNIYPMYTDNRKREITKFQKNVINFYQPQIINDYTHLKPLEGTGAMVLDRVNKICYCVVSQRANETTLDEILQTLNYQKVLFKAYQNDKEIYHTNVLMAVTTNFIFIGDSLIAENDRQRVLTQVKQYHDVITLTPDQILKFAGNCLELTGKNGNFIVMSETAYQSLTQDQITQITNKTRIIPVAIPTIETVGGGSARCMIAEIF